MRQILALAVFVLFCTTAFSQGIIRGKVTDGITGEAMIGANVLIEGTSKGAMADLDGNFSLEGIAAGTYNVVCSFISYEKVVVSGVVVNNGKVTIINIDLKPVTFVIEDGAEIVVKADRAKDNYMENVKKKDAAVMDYISSQQIKKTGDSDAGSALKRVTGVSTVGNYVFVRGLSDRYIKTTLNGAEIPSLDPKRNSVQMDLFPTNLIDNLVVMKTANADLPADYSGAYINVITKDFPEEFMFNYSGSFGYNTNATFNNDFLSSTQSSTDWLGFDNGTRDVPSEVSSANGVPQQDFSNYYDALVYAGYGDELNDLGITSSADIGTGAGQTSIGSIVNQIDGISSVSQVNNEFLPAVREANNEELSNMTKSFANNWSPIKRAPILDLTQSISFGNQTKLFGKPLGYLFGFQYKRTNRFYDDGITGRYKLTGEEEGATSLNTERRLSDAQGTESVYTSALINFSYKLSDNNKIGITYMPNISGVNSSRYQDGINPSDEVGLGQEQRMQRYLERNMNVYQLRGEHYLPSFFKSKIDWLGSYTRGRQETPDLRVFINSYRDKEPQTFYFDADGNNVTEEALNILAEGENLNDYFPGYSTQIETDPGVEYSVFDNLYPSPTRYYRKMIDNTLDLKLNIEFPFENKTGLQNKLKFGGSYVSKTRDYTEERYSFIASNINYNGNPEEYFAEENMNVVPGSETGYIYLRDDTEIQNSYSAYQNVLGAYGMLDINATSKLRINTGVRVETTDMLLESEKLKDSDLDAAAAEEFRGSLNLVDVLPSLNVTYLLRQYDLQTTNLRFAASRSVARPMFREKAPYSVFDFEVQEQQTGNTDLDRTLISNLDLRLEHYSRPGEIFSASFFYKDFTNPIEQVIISTASNVEITWVNVDQAQVWGAEFEVRKSLSFLGEKFSPFGFGFNVTLVKSATTISADELELIRATDPNHADTRPMYGQSPYVINSILSYDNDSIGLNAALSFNIQGPQLVLVTKGGTPDVYDQPRGNLDFTVSKRLGERFSLGIKANNLLNPVYRQTYVFKGTEYDFQKMTWGRTFSLTFGYRI